MIIIRSYRLENREGIYFVHSHESMPCPICRCYLNVRGRRPRKLIDILSGEKTILLIRRLYCEKCSRIHHELPDCVVPYKRHSRESIEAIIEDRGTVACETGTIMRIKSWWKIVLEYYLQILKSIETKYEMEFGDPMEFKELIRAVVNTNNWISAKKLCTRPAYLSVS